MDWPERARKRKRLVMGKQQKEARNPFALRFHCIQRLKGNKFKIAIVKRQIYKGLSQNHKTTKGKKLSV